MSEILDDHALSVVLSSLIWKQKQRPTRPANRRSIGTPTGKRIIGEFSTEVKRIQFSIVSGTNVDRVAIRQSRWGLSFREPRKPFGTPAPSFPCWNLGMNLPRWTPVGQALNSSRKSQERLH